MIEFFGEGIIYILGVSDDPVRATAILLHDGKIIAGLEEAKLGRHRAGSRELYPAAAIEMCCRQAGIALENVDRFVYYGDPYRRFRSYIATHLKRNPHRPLQTAYAAMAEANILRRHRHSRREQKIEWQYADHIRAHAGWSFYNSPFDSAAILVLCGYGDPRTVVTGVGEGTSMQLTRWASFPDSLGWLYANVTQAVGCKPGVDEVRLQWMSTAGEPALADLFKRLVDIDRKNLVRINREFLSSGFHPVGFNSQLSQTLRQTPVKDVAASLQGRLEEVCLALADRLRAETKMDSICLAGGVADNSLLVTRLQQAGIFKHVFVPPAPGNAGAAGGAALDAWFASKKPAVIDRRYSGNAAFAIGPDFNDQQIKSEIDACKVPSRFINSEAEIINVTSGLLSRGLLVGWFHGRTELGRRALGYRSILADAANEFVQDNINRYLKRREAFHPFAVSITRESADQYFSDIDASNAVLGAAARLKADAPYFLQRLKFRDDWVRVHTVEKSTNAQLWNLLTHFSAHSGHPILINTSLNLAGEPLASHPRDALRMFFASALDALVIGRFVLEK